MTSRSIAPAAIVACLLAFVARAQEGGASAEIDVATGGTIVVTLTVGDVKIETWRKAKARLVNRDGDERHGSRIVARETADGVTFECVGRQGDFRLAIPESSSLELTVSAGDIRLESDIAGDLRLTTHGGDIRAREVGGAAHMKTAAGDAAIKSFKGELRIKTAGGDVLVSGGEGDAYLKTAGGDVFVKGVRGKVEAATPSGDVYYELGANAGGTNLDAGSGDVIISVPDASVGAEIELTARNARSAEDVVRSDFPGEVEDDGRSDFPGEVEDDGRSDFPGEVEDDGRRGGQFRATYLVNGGGPKIRASVERGEFQITKKR
jgi:uncharacterized protein YaaQ